MKSTERNRKLMETFKKDGGKMVMYKAGADDLQMIDDIIATIPDCKTKQAAIDYCLNFTHRVMIEGVAP